MVHDFQADIDAVAALPAVTSILEVVCRTTGMGFAAVARVTPERWIVCAVKDGIAFGLKPGDELKVESTICHEIRQSGEGVVIDHVAEDPAFAKHHTPLQYGFQSYISMPIMLRDGSFFGTLCSIDPKPAQLNNRQTIDMFKLFADLIAFHLDANRSMATSEANLIDERQASVLREQFIAVLGHDLRNPLAAIDGGIRMLSKEALSERGKTITSLMHASVLRMAGLIDNVVDFARGRLGGDWSLNASPQDLQPILEHVIGEMRAAYPARKIEAAFALDTKVACDRGRISQLFSNLLGNAMTHGTADTPVRVRVSTVDSVFELTVINAGEEIPEAMLPQLFRPYVRGQNSKSREGLGLGLYIASQIAKAHGGELTATSSPDETCFTFRMPLGK